MTIEGAISYYEGQAVYAKDHGYPLAGEWNGQIAEWLKILKSAQFEYHEAWRVITHPTPDVTYADRDRAQIILDTFRDSLGRMEC